MKKVIILLSVFLLVGLAINAQRYDSARRQIITLTTEDTGDTFVCNQSAVVNLTASGNTQIIALSASKSIRICHISLSFDAASNFSLREGTGSDCGTSDTALTGVYLAINSITLDFGADAALRGSSAQALCVLLSTTVNVGGVITYAQF